MQPRKLIANLNEKGLGHVSIHHKAQGAEMDARIYAGFFGNNEHLKGVVKKCLIKNKDLDIVIINGERLK
mgnify:CR=1 FL=1